MKKTSTSDQYCNIRPSAPGARFQTRGAVAPPNRLRLSVGLEHADDLIADSEQALSGAAINETIDGASVVGKL